MKFIFVLLLNKAYYCPKWFNGNGSSSGEDKYILIILLNRLLKTTASRSMMGATEERVQGPSWSLRIVFWESWMLINKLLKIKVISCWSHLKKDKKRVCLLIYFCMPAFKDTPRNTHILAVMECSSSGRRDRPISGSFRVTWLLNADGSPGPDLRLLTLHPLMKKPDSHTVTQANNDTFMYDIKHLKFKDLLLVSITYCCTLNIFGCWTVTVAQTTFGPWKTVKYCSVFWVFSRLNT